MTQEQLAQQLNISNQAVSKWESAQSYPDIQLVPQLADIFGISIDALFDRNDSNTVTQTQQQSESHKLPWENDGMLHAVLYLGHEMVAREKLKRFEKTEMCFTYEGSALNIDSMFSVNCDDVEGNVMAGTDVECGDVGGDMDVNNCDDIGE